MQNTKDRRDTIVTARLFTEAQNVINHVRNNHRWGYLLDSKLGDQDNEPMTDKSIAKFHAIPFNSVRPRMAHIIDALSQTDQRHGDPLAETAQRANSVMSRSAVINLHHRRPPLYSEATLAAFVKLDTATPRSLPIIRAAGYVLSPPVVPRSHAIDSIIADVAAPCGTITRTAEPSPYPSVHWPPERPPQQMAATGPRSLHPTRDGYSPERARVLPPGPTLGRAHQRPKTRRQHDAPHIDPGPFAPYNGVPR